METDIRDVAKIAVGIIIAESFLFVVKVVFIFLFLPKS
jgi:hypothetical protein